MRRTKLPKKLKLDTITPDHNNGRCYYSQCCLYSLDEGEFETFWKCFHGEFPAVYFLMQGNQVVYIGSTMYPTRRITYHMSNKEFDLVKYFETDRFRQIEKKYIRMFQPKYNKFGLSDYPYFGRVKR